MAQNIEMAILTVLFIIMMIMNSLIIPIFTSPIQRAQVILQCKKQSDEPLGAVLVFKKIIKHEGYWGLWKLYLPVVILFFVKMLIKLTLSALMPSIFENVPYRDSRSYIVRILMCSCMDSVREAVPSILTYPLLFAQIKLANDAKLNGYSRIQYRGINDLFKKTLLNDGISCLYSGIIVYLLALIGFKTINCSLVGLMHSFSLSINSTVSIHLARYFAVSVIYPLIVLKSRVIVKPKDYRGINIWKPFTDIIKKEEIIGLFESYLLFVLNDLISLFITPASILRYCLDTNNLQN